MILNISYSGWVPIVSAIIILPGSAAGYFAYQNDLGAWPFIAIGVIIIFLGAMLVSLDPKTLFKKKHGPSTEAER